MNKVLADLETFPPDDAEISQKPLSATALSLGRGARGIEFLN